MEKVLIANQDIKQNSKLCQCLSNYSNLQVIGTTNGLSALEQYKTIRPDIFILDTNLKDISYTEIIDKLNFDLNDRFNCNIILISSTPNESINITNVAKLYKAFSIPYEFQDISDTIKEMSLHTLNTKIDSLFLKTRIPLRSSASNRVREALIKCYYNPNLLNDLQSIYDLVGKDFKTTGEGIRSSFRTILKPLNLLKNNTIFRYFEKEEDVTPKNFLEVGTYYLHNFKK